jgi:cysteine-rich repeat protein
MVSTTRKLALVVLGVLGVAFTASCGDNIVPQQAIDAPTQLCANGMVEGTEDCDDGDTVLDPTCDEACHFTCGNGRIDDAFGEQCDTGIASGAGACPTTCDDGMSCTQDSVAGQLCEATCVNAPITAAADDDGCCPSGANSTTDNDCEVACGNGVLETGEICDTGIATGVGACPTTCDDMMSCTADTLVAGGTCQAMCTNTPITAPMNGDGCCPTGATPATDDDCQAGCGNGVVDAGETCDTAIANGPGRCPTTCTDGMACTRDVLANGGTCNAVCTFPPITTPMTGDGCCPTGANNNTDGDCAPVCGNSVVEQGEQCDDGNNVDSDACNNMCRFPVTAFKFTDLDLRDPHAFVSFLGCRDVTPNGALGFSVNDALHDNITTDGDNDGFLDLAPTLVFRQFTQTAASQPVELHFARCTAPAGSTTCSNGTSTVQMATATYMATGTCLTFLPGTERPYTDIAIGPATGPSCFSTNAVTVNLNLGGIPITLHDARIGARYSGNPATGLTNGLLMGFISETDANATTIPDSFAIVGGQPLSSLLPGGQGNCNCNGNCGTDRDDKDVNGVVGWWFYLNFTASKVPWTGT